MAIYVLHRLPIVAAIAALALLLSWQFGAWPALGIIAVIAALCCGLGTLLLKASTVGKVTWKNRVAGYLLPWGFTLGGGQLPGISLVVWLSWLLIAAFTLAVARYSPSTASVGWGRAGVIWLTWTSWLILGGTALLLLYRFVQFSRGGGSAHPGVTKALLLTGVLLLVSIGAFAAGYPWLALLIAGVPIVLTLLPVTVLLLLMLGAKLSGKPVRWN